MTLVYRIGSNSFFASSSPVTAKKKPVLFLVRSVLYGQLSGEIVSSNGKYSVSSRITLAKDLSELKEAFLSPITQVARFPPSKSLVILSPF